tara:strand:- start:11277 stop:11756 length:480 start_codon:yes stop_codon:yes gene_type:complete
MKITTFKYYQYLIITLGLVFSLCVTAQEKRSFEERMERMKTLKRQYFNENISFTEKEKSEYWPIHDKHQKNIWGLHSREKKQLRKFRELGKEASEEDSSYFLDEMSKIEIERHQEKLRYFEELKTILPSSKILDQYKAEGDFNENLIKRYRRKDKARNP